MTYAIDVNVLMDAFDTEDDVGAVLRGHLLAEQFLNWYIERRLVGELSSYVRPPREFGGKLGIAAALGLPLEFAAVARQLNNIRNKLAHSLHKLNPSQVEQLGRDVNKLLASFPGQASLEERYIQVENFNGGERYHFGQGPVRHDFGFATMFFLITASNWSIVNGL